MNGLAVAFEVLLACAPQVAPETVEQIIQVESGGNPLALNINGAELPRQPHDATDAAALARHYLEQGHTVDLGLMQVNSDNLLALGYTVEEMFEPCKNLDAGARILSALYNRARAGHDDEQQALRAALSAYNTGSFTRGFDNGYVARYFAAPAPTVAVQMADNPHLAGTAVFVRQRSPETHPDQGSEPDMSGVDGVVNPAGQIEPASAQSGIGDFSSAPVPADDPYATAVMVAGKATWKEE